MSYSNFDFLKDDFPGLYDLADTTEYLVFKDPFSAMIHIQEIMRTVIKYIVGDTGIITSDSYMDGVIHSLWKNKLIEDDMYQVLREIELFDNRESEVIVDLSKVEHLFIRMYDFTIWFYKTYVNDAFIPNAFIKSVIKEKNLTVTQQKSEMKIPVQLLNIDGTVRKAQWVNNLKILSNYVNMKYENGERYEGQVYKGLKHGRGLYTWQDGTVYLGNWSNDLEHGYGEKLFANGDVYRGNWKNGSFHAHGTYIWKSGQIYEGQWEDGFENGYGSKTTSNGVKTRGFWTYGEFVHSVDQLHEEKRE